MIKSIRRYIKDLVLGPPADHALRSFVNNKQLTLGKVIHVGAHHAEEHDFYEALGVREVLWIEGSEKNFQQLRDILAAKANGKMKSICLNALVSNTEGETVELRQYNNDGASNTIYAGTEKLEQKWPNLKETGRREVLTTSTLDRLASEAGFLDVDLLVVDVQRAELLVLKGADKVLRRVKAVISEVSTREFYAGGALQGELKELLSSYGFKARSRTPVHGDQLFLRASSSPFPISRSECQ